MADPIAELRDDPVAFVGRLVDPESGRPFVLYPEEERFLREGLTLTSEARLPYGLLIFSAPRKSGKSTLAALIVLFVVLACGERYPEAILAANDLEQAAGRIFQACVRIVQATPALRKVARILATQILFPTVGGGASITAVGADFRGAAGANPNIVAVDEIWGFTQEAARRLWDELSPSPTRRVSVRLVSTYAGYSGESKLLESLQDRALKGETIAPDLYRQPGLLAYWSHELRAPWQSETWREQMRAELRPSAYLRLIENRFVAGDELYLPVAWWDRAASRWPLLSDPSLPVYLGIDAALKRDSAAIAVGAPAYYDDGSTAVALIGHRIFTPTPSDPIDLEDTLEAAVLEYARRFDLEEVRYDPWQFARSAQGLQKAGINMVEFPQSMPNLTRMSSSLYELMKGGNLIAYPDDAIRQAIQHAVAIETSRGLKIAKEKASHKIDIVVATAMAALGVVENGGYVFDPDEAATIASASHYTFHLGRTWT